MEFSKKFVETGKRVANPPPGENVIISGVSGKFPNSYNFVHYGENLMNKQNLCDEDERRFEHRNIEIPRNSGKLFDLSSFDPGFFGLHPLQAHYMDPSIRIILETTYEAIIDAGLCVRDFAGTNTGVFIGVCSSDSQKFFTTTMLMENTYSLFGTANSSLANCISYWLKLNGPSFCCDTACSSSMYTFEEAYRSIREGKCDRAIVGGVNILLDPKTLLQFARLGVLNINKLCKPFDNDGSGYTRSESVCVVILQKAEEAKRIYAEVIHAKSNADGNKAEGITFPSTRMQVELLEDIYRDCGVSVDQIGFIEAHGTGTLVGDVQELNAVDKVFFGNGQRKKPLFIGSVKGNIGHGEAASGLNSICKVLYAMNRGYIPPNIHFDQPREGIEGLATGRLQVVTEKTSWPEDAPYAGINSFGFGGANAHLLLKRYKKPNIIGSEKIPRLVCFSGRTEECISSFQNSLKENPNGEVMNLLQAAFRREVPNNDFYGYSIISENGEIKRSVNNFVKEKPLYLCLGGQHKYNEKISEELCKLPLFSKSIAEFNAVLKNNNLSQKIEESIPMKQVMLSLSIQLSLINLLKALDLNPTYIKGTYLGHFSAAFANDALSFEETILVTYITYSFMLVESTKPSKNSKEELIKSLKSILSSTGKDTRKQILSMENPYEYATPEYFVFNIFDSEMKTVFEQDCVVLSIDFDDKIENCEVVNLVRNDMKLEHFLDGIGRLYELGYELRIEGIYPESNWPVDPETPPISHLVKWKHDKEQFVVKYSIFDEIPCCYRRVFYDATDHGSSYLKGHVVDGRNLFPATGYLITVIEQFCAAADTSFFQQIVEFENIQFLKATTFGQGELVFEIYFGKTGRFEIVSDGTPIVTGTIKKIDKLEPFSLPEFKETEVQLSQKDVYKELRLRGYNYSGLFSAIQETCGNRAKVQWNNNYITFLDNMLQFTILQEDGRVLYVPTGIDRLIINVPEHQAYLQSHEEDIPIFFDTKTKSLLSRAIKFVGVQASSIPRRKQFLEPLLEINKFVPNEANLTLKESLKVNAQIILENINHVFFDVLEQIEEERVPIVSILKKSLEDNPLVLINTKVISQLDLQCEEIDIVKESITTQANYFIYIGKNLIQRQDEFEIVLVNISKGGFLILFEDKNVKIPDSLVLITKYHLENSTLYMLRKKERQSSNFVAINISADLSWISPLQNAIPLKKDVLIYAENQPESGILGLTNCLKREIQNTKISSFFLENAPKLDFKSDFYQKQRSKNLQVNVFKNGIWGTYRYLPMEEKLCQRDHSFGNVLKPGDLNTLKWIEGPISSKNPDIIYIYNSALNFRDLMTASGKVSIETITKNRMEQECIQGLEFSGRNIKGERLMGVLPSGAISTYVVPNKNMLWKIPDGWSMEEAASVPVVYSTVLFALKIRCKVQKGQSILIHSGTGGVGLAAINLALHYGLEIFTTVGTEEKREFLTKNYPLIKPGNIGNSRDLSFEQMIYKNTNGRGVDYVLNSLAEEKLIASIRCLARNGTFLEIGKFDIGKNSKLALDLHSKSASFSGIMLDKLMFNGTEFSKDAKTLTSLLQEGIAEGFIKPLPVTSFEREQLQEAYRYIGSGKHIGKIIIKQRQEEVDNITVPKVEKFSVIPRTYFDSEASYIILGGLGGFGLELADWMALRGARNIILSSRTGVKNGYQQNALRKLKSMGVNVKITLENIKTFDGCEKIYQQATDLGQLEGIFNLAVELKDGLFENLTKADFEISLGPKPIASTHFDKITRKYCSQLKHFVLFSSVSCGRGNAGQTNYGLSNSIMERLCERRKADGLPGLAIQWGAIGDVGIVAEMQKEQSEIVIGGTLQQRISSCLEVLDKFLQNDEAVVSSIVIAVKGERKKCDNMVDAVMNILGIRDLKTVSGHATLPELGMDSMMAVEIKQILEGEYDTFLSPQELKNLTINKMIELESLDPSAETIIKPKSTHLFDIFFSNLYDESNYYLPKIDFIENEKESKVFIFPGVEGTANSVTNLSKKISKNSTCLQYISTNPLEKTIDIVNNLWPHIVSECKNGFKFVAHSIGSTIALEIASKLESLGIYGKLVMIDGSPALAQRLGAMLSHFREKDFQYNIIIYTVIPFIPKELHIEFKIKLNAAKNFNEMQQVVLDTIPETKTISKKMFGDVANFCYNAIKTSQIYVPQFPQKIKSQVILIKPNVPTIANFAEDLQLSEICENITEIKYFDGNHKTVVDNPEMIEAIAKFLQ